MLLQRLTQPPTMQNRVDLNLEDLPADLGLRKRISIYDLNDQDVVRRTYL